MSIQEDIFKALVELPEIRSIAECENELSEYCDYNTKSVQEIFSQPFPRDLLVALMNANIANNVSRNKGLVKQVWEAVVDLPVAALPKSAKRRKMM